MTSFVLSHSVHLAPVRFSSSGEELMRTLCLPALPLHLFLNRDDELTKSKCGSSKGTKWKHEYDQYSSHLGKDTCFSFDGSDFGRFCQIGGEVPENL